VGRDHEAVIRVNSRSGKGGIAYLLNTHHGLDLPRRLQIDLSAVVQRAADGNGEEVTAEQLWRLFGDTYPDTPGPVALARWATAEIAPGVHEFTGVHHDGRELRGTGNGPLSALAAALAGDGIEVDVLHYAQHATGPGGDSRAVAYVEARTDGFTRWGAGRDTSVLAASVGALVAAVNAALAERGAVRSR
jgi:2-isopropylmalate synthase